VKEQVPALQQAGYRTITCMTAFGATDFRAPHGCNVSHAEEWNTALLEFLAR
jgi:hypothetical protein